MPVDEMVEERSQKKGKKSIAKAEFQNKNEFFKAIIDGLKCGVLSIDGDGRVVKINNIAKRILGLDEKADTDGKHISTLLDKHPYFCRLMLESFHMSTLPSREEMEISCRGDEKKKIGFSISLVKEENGQNIGSSIFFRDLTKIEEKEEQERLKERLAALGHMSASLAHELKNPLGAIEINASFLKRKIGNDKEALEIVDGIMSDINRLKVTINESLSFVKALELNLSPSYLDRLIDNAISFVLTETDSKKIQINKDYEKKLGPFMLDSDLMTKVLINIFQNSIEAMNGKGNLNIELKKLKNSYDLHSKCEHSVKHPYAAEEQAHVRIRIEDNGKGIPREIIDKIFYPFFTTKEKGSGLGLSFSKKVVDSHKGMIDVESQIGSGTTFTIQIPINYPSR